MSTPVTAIAENFRSGSWLITGLFGLVLMVYCVGLAWQLAGDDYLRGPDAYYQALQADHWARTGQVRIPDSSPVHRINGLLVRMGLDGENAVRLWTSLSIFSIGLMMLVLWRGYPAIALGYLTWYLLSPSLLFIAIEFQRLFAVFMLFPLLFWYLRRSGMAGLPALIPAFAAVLVHKAAFVFAGPLAMLALLRSGGTRLLGDRSFQIWVALAVVSVLLYLVVDDRLRISDLQRLGTWQALVPGVITLLGREAVPVPVRLEVGFALTVFLVAIMFEVRRRGVRSWRLWCGLILILPAVLPLPSVEVFGVGERFAMLLPVLSSFYLVLFAEPHAGSEKQISYSWLLILPAVVTAAFILRIEYSHPLSLDPDNGAYAEVTASIRSYELPMLVAHRGLNFYYKYVTHAESFPYEPETHWDKSRVWRLAYRITADEFSYYLPEKCAWGTGLIHAAGRAGYTLIREDCWVEFRDKIRPDQDESLYDRVWHYWRNPATRRPAFLYPKHRGDDDGEFSALQGG